MYSLSAILVTRLLTRRLQPRREAGSWVKRAKGLGQPVKAILVDYAHVFKDLFTSARSHPLKATAYISVGSLLVAAVKKRPDYTQYLNDVLTYGNELSMCSDMVRNPTAVNYIDDIIKHHYDRSLTYINLGVVALIMRNPHSAQCSNFRETCSSLQPRLWTCGERVMDVGVWGRWLLLDTNLKDFDVNTEQLSHLSNQEQ